MRRSIRSSTFPPSSRGFVDLDHVTNSCSNGFVQGTTIAGAALAGAMAAAAAAGGCKCRLVSPLVSLLVERKSGSRRKMADKLVVVL